jgi:hypothetical protein
VEMIVATLREAGALEAAVVPEVDAVYPASNCQMLWIGT